MSHQTHPVVDEVTRRITERSARDRLTYLSRIADAASLPNRR